MTSAAPPAAAEGIAIVGMSCRFRRAAGPAAFWRLLRDGVDALAVAKGSAAGEAGLDCGFDGARFGMSPREVATLDAQHRLLLTCAREALEDAGLAVGGAIGVYAGAGEGHWAQPGRGAALGSLAEVERLPGMLGSERDYLATRISYKLGLTGPSLAVQSAGSTALLAVQLACEALLNGECDAALAGAVAVGCSGHPHWLSPDGRCRPFDADAAGTVWDDGAGVVVLEPLAAARAAGRRVRAIVRGAAAGHDGRHRVGSAVPGREGAAAVVARAYRSAAVDPRTVRYVEADAAGLPHADAAEVAALGDVFRAAGDPPAACALGSVKSNLGHLEAAAGIAGLLKTVLALEQRWIPPTLHLRRPHPELELTGSPFYVTACGGPWPSAPWPRRAGVSSFGIGGVYAHVVLEEAPPAAVPAPS